LLGKDYLALIHPDEREDTAQRVAKRLKKEPFAQRYEVQRLKKDGTTVWCEMMATAIDYRGRLAVMGNIIEIAERKWAEEKILRQSMVLDGINKVFRETLTCESEQEVAGECLSVAEELTGSKFGFIGELNPAGLFDTIAISNPGGDVCKIPGSEAARLIKNMRISGIDRSVLRDEKSRIVNEPASHPDRTGTPEGHPPITSFLGVPLKHRERTVGMIGLANKESGYDPADQQAIEDLSMAFVEALERKRAEGQIKASLKEKEVLLQEIHHRVKNNIQVIISLLRLQAEKIGDKKYAELLKESQDRIGSMALVHEELYKSKDFANIDFGEYVKSLVKNLYTSYGVDANKIRLNVEVESIRFDLGNAIPCGLIINELGSNSLKHAFPDERDGKIEISLKEINEDDIELTVTDDGVGIPKSLNIKQTDTMGMNLIKVLAEHQLGGKIGLDRTDGTQFKINFKKAVYKGCTLHIT